VVLIAWVGYLGESEWVAYGWHLGGELGR